MSGSVVVVPTRATTHAPGTQLVDTGWTQAPALAAFAAKACRISSASQADSREALKPATSTEGVAPQQRTTLRRTFPFESTW